jgi:hypothetical protein
MVTDTKPVSMQVVDQIASQLACDPLEIDPLADSIDPEALDNIVATSTKTQVSFEHAGFTVDVSSDDEGTVIEVTQTARFGD